MCIRDRLGYELKVEDMEFDAIVNSVKSGKADFGAAGMTVTEDRKKSVEIPQREKERRSAEMIRRTDQTRLAFLHSQVGRTEEVLLETQVSPGEYEGYTKNYTPCLVQTPQTAGESDSVDLCGQIKYVTITGVSDGRCTAVLADVKS